MQLTVSGGGLKATTKDHGLTEYWAHRLTTCSAPTQFPRLFCWVYRHEGRRLRHELRCHAVLCPTAAMAQQIEQQLKHSLAQALAEFKRDKLCKQNARLSLVNSVYENPTIPRRKILLSTGPHNYRPPLERSKSAPKLTSIEEIIEEEEENTEAKSNVYRKILRHYDSTSALLDKRKCYLRKFHDYYQPSAVFQAPIEEDPKVDDFLNEKILEELVQDSLLDSCEKAWSDLLVDSDEGSLSSGCESASTATSDLEAPLFPTIAEEQQQQQTDLDFKVGGCVLATAVRTYEKINYKTIMAEEVSLVPVGETHNDFSSLKVFKRRSCPSLEEDVATSEGENDSACSDESGYEEEDVATSVANIVLV